MNTPGTRGSDAITAAGLGPRCDGQLVLIYFGAAATEGLEPAALKDQLAPTESLRSRVGKKHQHHVAAQAGIAWSADKSEVALVELFEPGDLASWQSRFYEEPPPFRK